MSKRPRYSDIFKNIGDKITSPPAKRSQSTRIFDSSDNPMTLISETGNKELDSFCFTTGTESVPEVDAVIEYICNLVAQCPINVYQNQEKDGVRKPNIRLRGKLEYLLMTEPCISTNRFNFLYDLVYDLLLYGNVFYSIHYESVDSLEVKHLHKINNNRVRIIPSDRIEPAYYLEIDGKKRDPSKYLHFRMGRSKINHYSGKGKINNVKDNASNLKLMEKAIEQYLRHGPEEKVQLKTSFMLDLEDENNKNYADMFYKLQKDIENSNMTVIPSDVVDYSVRESKRLVDLDVETNKRIQIKTIANNFGVPLYVLNEGDYNSEEYNNFVKRTIEPICDIISQELTKKITYSERVFIKLKTSQLYDTSASDREANRANKSAGILTTNEVREKEGVDPIDEEWADEVQQLENYIPARKAGEQKKVSTDNSEEESQEK